MIFEENSPHSRNHKTQGIFLGLNTLCDSLIERKFKDKSPQPITLSHSELNAVMGKLKPLEYK
jgi:hypothetical protein